MAIPRGNELWKIKSKYDKDTLLTSPDLLLEAAFEYFAWCDKHPLTKYEAVKSGAECGRILDIPLRRPYSLNGFCAYIGCSMQYIEQTKVQGNELLTEALARIQDLIKAQLFEGAAVGVFNTSIVSKSMGDAMADSADAVVSDTALHIEVLDEQTKQQLLLLQNRGAPI